MRVLTLTAAALLLVAGAVACGADRESYVQRNERILETLPEVAGSQRLSVDSSPYYLREQGPADGYTTNIVYQAPPEITDQEVVDFYIQRLKAEWEYCVEEVPITDIGTGQSKGTVLSASFIKGGASLWVGTDGMLEGRPHTFEIAVDHRTYRNFCTGEDLR